MPISDSNPERRNLLLISVSIIIYFLAGGRLIDDQFRLLVINVEFSKPEVLAYAMWCFFAWFWYRYWVINKDMFSEGFENDLLQMQANKILCWYINKKLAVNTEFPQSKYFPTGITVEKYKIIIVYSLGTKIERNSNGTWSSLSPSGDISSKYTMNSFVDTLVSFYLILSASVTRSSVSSYLLPHAIACVCLIMGVVNVF